MELPSSLITSFLPSANLLLDCIRPHVNDAMLMFIARTDYGQMANEMFAQLRPIRDIGVIPLQEVGEVKCWD